MTLTIELTPALARKLRERAAREGRDAAQVAAAAVEEYLRAAPRTGAQMLAAWEREGVLGIWQDRPEDSVELAREFRRQAEARGPGA